MKEFYMSIGLVILVAVVALLLVVGYGTAVLMRKRNEALLQNLEERKEALYNLPVNDEVEEVKKWYNGYHFGKNEVYNPWSIVNFLDDKILEEHWVNTSNNDEIMNYLENSDENY